MTENINSQQIGIFSRWKVSDSIAFLVGLFASFYVNTSGQLYVSEILLILLAPVLWLQSGRQLLRNVDVRKIITLGGLWFLGQALTDLIRQTPVPDLMRGWAAIIVLLISFSSLYLLLGNKIRRIKIFTFGYILSGLLSLYVQPSPYFSSYPWEFGFGGPLTLLTLLFIIVVSKGHLKLMRKWFWLIIAVGALSFFLNARSLGAFAILSGVILWLRTSPFTWRLLARFRVSNLFIITFLFVGIIWGLLQGYAYLAGRGLLGQVTRDKFEMQYSGNVWGLLLGGRSEILASGQAILDSPIIGHGSWAKGVKYRLLLYKLTYLGYQTNFDQLDYYINGTDLIPAHSHITQAWVWAGVLGAIFWGWVLVFVGRMVLRINIMPNELYPLIVYFSIAAVWDILFSPFGSSMRLAWALRFVIFLSVPRLVKMKVSIVTISYNQSRFLEQAICSVLEQGYPNIEYIVVDPGSTDGSRDIIQKYRGRISKIIFEPDKGPADGLNKGFAAATGEIYGFLNADDYLLPGSISIIADGFQKNTRIDVVSGHGYFVDEYGKILRGVYSHRLHRLSYAYGSVVLVQQSTYFKREIFEQIGGFNIKNHINWDGELWADMLIKQGRFRRIHSYLSAFRIHRSSITGSRNSRSLLESEQERISRKLGVKHFYPLLGKAFWLFSRLSDPQLIWLQIRNGMHYGFTSPIGR